jgi:hypothetical protein
MDLKNHMQNILISLIQMQLNMYQQAQLLTGIFFFSLKINLISPKVLRTFFFFVKSDDSISLFLIIWTCRFKNVFKHKPSKEE